MSMARDTAKQKQREKSEKRERRDAVILFKLLLGLFSSKSATVRSQMNFPIR
jgi:hypothetical protein